MGHIRADLLEARGRRTRALEEALNYSADIMCLQGVDEVKGGEERGGGR
jgi:mRNA deadenylase 3'-5' endonuclease subunit Ccr4